MPAADLKPVHPLLELFKIAGPTVATMTSYTLMQFVDKWLVSHLGPQYVGAQGNGGLAAWVPQSIAMGILTVVNTYVSQNLGAGKPGRGPAYAWNGVWLAIGWWLLLLPYAAFLPRIFALAKMDPQQAEWATIYGRILLYGAALNLCTRAISQFFYGMQKATVVMVAGICANVLNLILGAVLIFGNGSVPTDLGLFGKLIGRIGHALNIAPQGIAGSAYGTIIATGLELAIPLTVFLGPKLNTLYNTRSAWRPSPSHIKDILRIGWAPGLMFGNEMICWAFFMVFLVSHFGPQHSSAGWIAHQYMSLSFMPAVGISVAVTALVGKCMGMGRPDLAAKRAWLGLGLAVAYMSLCGGLFIIFRVPMMRLFIDRAAAPELSDQIVELGSQFLIATACFQLFDAIAMTLSGALRGAGDTIWVGVWTVGLSWGIIVLGGLGMIEYFPHLGSLGPWIAAASYIASLAIVVLLRFLSGHWKSIKLVKDGPLADELLGAAAGTSDATA